MGSRLAQFLTEPKMSRTSPQALGPTTQQNALSPMQVRFPPLKNAGRGCFHSLVWEVSAAASAHPPVALGQLQSVDKDQAFAPMAPRPPSPPNNKKHSNIRTASPQKRKAPVFSLCPQQTDYILYKLTIIQKKPNPTSTNFRKKDVVA